MLILCIHLQPHTHQHAYTVHPGSVINELVTQYWSRKKVSSSLLIIQSIRHMFNWEEMTQMPWWYAGFQFNQKIPNTQRNITLEKCQGQFLLFFDTPFQQPSSWFIHNWDPVAAADHCLSMSYINNTSWSGVFFSLPLAESQLNGI